MQVPLYFCIYFIELTPYLILLIRYVGQMTIIVQYFTISISQPQIINKISNMFASKIRRFSRLVMSRSSSLLHRQKHNSHKFALIAASLLLIPTYVHTQTSPPHNQQSNTQSETKPVQHQQQQLNAGDRQIKTESNQIMHFIESYQDAKKLNLQGNTLVWFQTTGFEHIDTQVIDMLTKFGDEKQKNISCPFKIIIDRTPRAKPFDDSQEYYKKQVQIVVIKPQNLKVIPLGKHLSFNGIKDLKYSNLFQRLTTQLNQFNQVNSSNFKQFVSGLGNKRYEANVIMTAPKDLIKLRKAKKKMRSFIDSKQAFAANTNKSIITDENVIRNLELPQFNPESDNIYVIVPESQNISKAGKVIRINDQNYHIIPSWAVNQSLVFSPYLQKSSPDSVTLRVTVDLNQNVATQMNQIYQILAKSEQYPNLASVPKFLTFQSVGKTAKPIQISVQKNNFDQIVNVYSPGCRYSEEEKRNILYSANKWKYNDDQISAEGLQQWIGDILQHKLEPQFQSQPKIETKVKEYNSVQLTGEQYVEALFKNKQKPKVIFHFSEHCFSCNKFKHIYEEIAGEQNEIFDFYRIDNDANKSQGLRNYNSTPVFALYKNGIPFYFKNTIFTKTIFQDFLSITNNLNLVNPSLIDKAVQQRTQNEFKISDLM